MRRFLSTILTVSTLAFILFIGPGFAQGVSAIERLEIEFWPEYDRPAVLIFYKIWLAEGTELPTQISVPIPADVEEVNAVAWGDEDGNLHDATYERQVSGDRTIITLDVEGLIGWVEFYEDLNFDGSLRNFRFIWPGGFFAEQITYAVQEPVGASDLTIDPASTTSSTRSDGLNYYGADLGPLSSEDELTIEFSYMKADDTLTEDTLVSSVPIPTTTVGRPSGGTPDVTEFLPWVIGIMGGLLILAGGILLVRYRSIQVRTSSRRRSRRARKRSDDKPFETETAPVFCHNCGAKASASDFYCRRCGTQLRR